MKRLIALLMAMILVVGLVACGSPETPSDPVDTAPSAENTTPAEPPEVKLEGTMTQDVTVNLLGNDIPVAVVRNFDSGAFRIDYAFNGNPVFAEGYVVDGAWEIVNTNNDFTFGTIEAVLPAIDDAAWVASGSELVVEEPAEEPAPVVDPQPSTDPAPVDPAAEAVAQTVTVDMMGNATEVYVVKTGNHFEMSYSAMGNDVVLTGSIAGDVWTMETTSVETVAAFAGNIVNSVVAAIDEAAWAPVVEAPVAQTVSVDMMGNVVDVYVVKTGNAFEMNYSSFGNNVVLTGSIAGGAWNMENASPAEVAAFAGNIVASVASAIDEAAWAPVE